MNYVNIDRQARVPQFLAFVRRRSDRIHFLTCDVEWQIPMAAIENREGPHRLGQRQPALQFHRRKAASGISRPRSGQSPALLPTLKRPSAVPLAAIRVQLFEWSARALYCRRGGGRTLRQGYQWLMPTAHRVLGTVCVIVRRRPRPAAALG